MQENKDFWVGLILYGILTMTIIFQLYIDGYARLHFFASSIRLNPIVYFMILSSIAYHILINSHLIGKPIYLKVKPPYCMHMSIQFYKAQAILRCPMPNVGGGGAIVPTPEFLY